MRLNERKKQFKKIPSIFREDRDKETVEEEKVIGQEKSRRKRSLHRKKANDKNKYLRRKRQKKEKKDKEKY